MPSFSTPLSGLNAASAALRTVSNNLANLNTDGFKSQTTDFSDLFYQNYGTNGSGAMIQSGLGVQISGTQQDMTNGAVSATGTASNIALNGAGYFVTRTAGGSVGYTRDGDFTTNSSGQLVTQGGSFLLGYPSIDGVVNQSGGLQPINVGTGTGSPASATSSFSLAANLNSGTAVGGTYQTPISVYDSLGQPLVLTVNYTKTATNTWSYNITADGSAIEGANGSPGTAGSPTSVGSGTLTFDSNGNLTAPTGNVAVSVGPLSDGAKTLALSWQVTASNGTSLITQTSSDSALNAKSQNGFGAGILSSYNVLSDGTVQATFTNGQTSAIGQVAVASFSNAEGLTLEGSSEYAASAASGEAVVGVAGMGGRGTISGSSVELSNVDLATQFSQLIVYQSAYQANAKTITAFDQLAQATIAMKS
jgi:flagellar hook protein FlgE